MAVTRHQRMSLPSASIIDPVIVPFQVAGGSPGWQVAGVAAAQRETGDRMIGWGGDNFQVSGLGHQVPGAGIQVQVQVRELSHRPISGGGWQPRVAGGGRSAICPPSSMQSSIQPSLCLSPSANRYPLTATTFFTSLPFHPPTPIPTPFPSLHSNVLPLHSSPSRCPDPA